MKKIRINTYEPYDVFIGSGLLREAGKLLKTVCQSRRLVIVTDGIVDGFYGEALQKDLETEDFSVLKYVIASGEKSKNISALEELLNFLAENHVRRNDAILALGGGMIGDLAGFAAAVYLRGIDVVQLPTTLLAMVDSAVGGKTGIDLPAGKNLVGAFHQPRLVIADTETLDTLPLWQLTAGMGEVIKYGIIRKNSILEDIWREKAEDFIAKCVEIKGALVEQDVRDCRGVREVLNAGHTVGHAIEKRSGYTIPHGKAVAMGLVAEAHMAVDLGLAEASVLERISVAVKGCDLYEKLPYSPEELADIMQNDKKNRDAKIAFVLPRAIGDCVHLELTVQQVTELLKKQKEP